MTRVFIRTVVFLAIIAALLFGSAGRIDWFMGWAYLAILTASSIIIIVLGDREMLRVRAGREKGTTKWDSFLAPYSFFLFWPGANVVAALDYGRFHWSPTIPLPVQLIALIPFTLGLAFAANFIYAAFLPLAFLAVLLFGKTNYSFSAASKDETPFIKSSLYYVFRNVFIFGAALALAVFIFIGKTENIQFTGIFARSHGVPGDDC